MNWIKRRTIAQWVWLSTLLLTLLFLTTGYHFSLDWLNVFLIIVLYVATFWVVLPVLRNHILRIVIISFGSIVLLTGALGYALLIFIEDTPRSVETYQIESYQIRYVEYDQWLAEKGTTYFIFEVDRQLLLGLLKRKILSKAVPKKLSEFCNSNFPENSIERRSCIEISRKE